MSCFSAISTARSTFLFAVLELIVLIYVHWFTMPVQNTGWCPCYVKILYIVHNNVIEPVIPNNLHPIIL